MFVDKSKTTTTKIYTDCLSFLDHVPGINSQERIYYIIQDYEKRNKHLTLQKNLIKLIGKKLGETDEEIKKDVEKYASDLI